MLENRRTTWVGGIKTVRNIKNKLNIGECSKGIIIYDKFDRVIEKLCWKTQLKISKMMSKENIIINNLSENYSSDGLIYFKYTPILLVDVKRNFLVYENLATDIQHSFTFKSLPRS